VTGHAFGINAGFLKPRFHSCIARDLFGVISPAPAHCGRTGFRNQRGQHIFCFAPPQNQARAFGL
jgi:hypothetical protein